MNERLSISQSRRRNELWTVFEVKYIHYTLFGGALANGAIYASWANPLAKCVLTAYDVCVR